ncbi:MAG TPA: SIR2 family protein [Thermoplasmata archaeon]|nr:SIR2 family protein [Thermoplasmata archaeon]
MTTPDSVDGIIEILAGSARRGELALWLGAGVSIPSGIPGALSISNSILSALWLDPIPPRVRQLPLEVIIGSLGGSFYGELLDVFSSAEPTFEHYAIAAIMSAGCTRRVVTTNFDELVEKAANSLSRSGRFRLDPTEEFRLDVDHLHGRASDPASVKATSEELVRNQARPELRSSLEELLAKDGHGLVLVLGYSFSDYFDINPTLRDIGPTDSRLILVNHQEAGPGFQVEDLNAVLRSDLKGSLHGTAVKCDTRALLAKLLARLSITEDFVRPKAVHQASPRLKLNKLQYHLSNARQFCQTVIRLNLTEAAWWGTFDSGKSMVEIPSADLSRMSLTAESVEDRLITNYIAAVAVGRRIATIRQVQLGSTETSTPFDVTRRVQQMRARMFLYSATAVQLLDLLNNPSPMLEAQCKLLYANCILEEPDGAAEGILVIEDLLERYRTVLPPAIRARLSSLLGNLYRVAGMPTQALPYLEEADRILQANYMALEGFVLLPALIEVYTDLGRAQSANEAMLRYHRVFKANDSTVSKPDSGSRDNPTPRVTYGGAIPIQVDPLPDTGLFP